MSEEEREARRKRRLTRSRVKLVSVHSELAVRAYVYQSASSRSSASTERRRRGFPSSLFFFFTLFRPRSLCSAPLKRPPVGAIGALLCVHAGASRRYVGAPCGLAAVGAKRELRTVYEEAIELLKSRPVLVVVRTGLF